MSATPYIGLPRPVANQDTPSPAPSPVITTVQPDTTSTKFVVNIPADADSNNVSTLLLQQYRTLADWQAWVAAATRSCPPISPVSTASPFTAVTHIGTDSGTVIPSGGFVGVGGVPAGVSGRNFVIQIVIGGAVGVATFKTSIDGGTTYFGPQTTAASMLDTFTGVTLAFANHFTATETYQFHSAVTPLLAHADVGGNIHALVDRHGFRMGRVVERSEDYAGCSAAISADATMLPGSVFRSGLAGAGTQLSFTLLTEGSGYWTGGTCDLTSATTNANRISLETAGLVHSGTADNHIFVAEWLAALDVIGANNQTIVMGLMDNTTAPRNNGANQIRFKKASTNTNWQLEKVVASTPTTVDSGVAPVANTRNAFRLEVHGSVTPMGVLAGSVSVAIFFIDYQPVGAINNIPGNTLALVFESANTAGLGGNQRLRLSPIRYSYNLIGTAAL